MLNKHPAISHEITSSGVRVRLICSRRELWGSAIHLNIIEFDKHIKVIQTVAIVYCIAFFFETRKILDRQNDTTDVILVLILQSVTKR